MNAAEKSNNKILRRRFLIWTVPLVGTAVLAGVFQSIYSGTINKLLQRVNPQLKLKSVSSNRNKKNRQRWNYDGLVLNTSSNVIHFPTEKIFAYYDQISPQNAVKIDINNWQASPNKNRINRDKSGIIFECLALKEIQSKIDDVSLDKAIAILSMAFSKEYISQNQFNWRVYDLLFSFIILNDSINPADKYSTFMNLTSKADWKFARIPKKNGWLKSKDLFENKAKHIKENLDLYTKRLEYRTKLYWSV